MEMKLFVYSFWKVEKSEYLSFVNVLSFCLLNTI